MPRELHEAADLEGVSAWQRLRWLLIPQLAPVIALNLVLITIASFNTFDLIIPLTGGGPARRTEVISLFMYRLGFFDLEAGARRRGRGGDAGRQPDARVGGRAADHARRSGCARGGGVVTAGPRQRALFVAGLAATAAAFLLPQLWLFSLSLKNKAGLFEYPPTWIPKGGSLANYRFVLTHSQVPWYLWNSLVVAACSPRSRRSPSPCRPRTCSRAIASAAERPLLAALLVVQMVSPVILLVPIYGIIERLGLIDTRAGLILVYAAMQVPFTVWVLKNFFDAVPASIFEAARLDGATRARTFWTIVLPIVAPGLGATAVFNLAAYWSEFCLALVLLDSQARYTMPLGPVQFSERLRHRLAPAGGRQLHRARAGDCRVRPSPALFRRRSHGGGGQGMKYPSFDVRGSAFVVQVRRSTFSTFTNDETTNDEPRTTNPNDEPRTTNHERYIC